MTTSPVRRALRERLTTAMRERDRPTASAILRAEVDGLLEAAREYDAAGRETHAGQARAAAKELSNVVHSVLGTTWG